METRALLILLTCGTLFGKGAEAQGCGEAPLNSKIVGGDDAAAGSWPWQVSMHLRGSHICGGTLISNQWVLTAAHCIFGTASAYALYLGRESQSGSNPNEVRRSVAQIIVHPDYNNTLYNNDIALMRLSGAVTFTDYIRPVCLASNISEFFSSTLCWSTGWGRLEAGGPLPSELQEVQIPVVGQEQCVCNYENVTQANITGNMICAGRANKGVCQGDSGGPLQCKQGARWVQAGITSFGIPCAVDGFPEIYARVSRFQAWITGHVTAAGVGFVTFTSNGTDPDGSFVCPKVTGTTTPTSDSVPSTHSAHVTLIYGIIILSLSDQIFTIKE